MLQQTKENLLTKKWTIYKQMINLKQAAITIFIVSFVALLSLGF